MPAIRIDTARLSYNPATRKVKGSRLSAASDPAGDVNIKNRIASMTVVQDSSSPNEMHFPIDASERKVFRTKSGKGITPHQWDVYDFTLSIPCGKVTTYKDVSAAIGGSPRSVGNALRINPFAPYVPCHRVIASNFFIGGFFGEWGKEHRTGTRCNQKLNILQSEGVSFDKKGHLIAPDGFVWRGK